MATDLIMAGAGLVLAALLALAFGALARRSTRRALATRRAALNARRALLAARCAALAAEVGQPHLMTREECLPLGDADVATRCAARAATGTPERQRIELTDVPWSVHSG